MKRQRMYLTLLSALIIAAFGISLASCGGGDDGAPPPPPPVTYSQADLTGTWHFNKLDAGSNAGWQRGTIAVSSTGAMTFPSFESSGGGTATGLAVTIHSATGIVSLTGLPEFHGAMSTNKKIIVATIKDADAPSMLIMQKATPGVTFTSADLANKSFTYHHVKDGAENDWEYGFGTTNGSGVVTLNTIYRPDPVTGLPTGGTLPSPVEMGTLSIDSSGIVTLGSNLSMRGVMSSDKKSMVITETGGDVGTESYTLTIVQITGQTFSQADLTGAWNLSMLAASDSGPGWLYGTASVNASGAATFPAWAQIDGGMPPTDVEITLYTDGILLEPVSNRSTHGAMSFGKDFAVLTATMDPPSGGYALVFMVRGTQAIVQDAAAILI